MTIINTVGNTIKPLKSQIIDLIRVKGSLSVADYMKIVLTNPTSGFYMNNDVFGVKGHFTTSPEISQIFGELLAAWTVNEWSRFGMTEPLRLVELGPGRGTLMSDIWRTITRLNKTKTNIQVNLIEISEKMQELQAENLKHISDIKWVSHINALDKLDDSFTVFIAHEYLDALPIYKFHRDNIGRWREILIDYDENENLRYCLAQQASPSNLLVPDEFLGDHIEINAEATIQVQKVVEHLNRSQKGLLLICDYGFEEKLDADSPKSNRNTFRGFKNHESWPPLEEPGTADLTSDVDFNFIKKQVEKDSVIFGSVSQEIFLRGCGLEARLQVLLQTCKNQEEKDELISGVEMLINDMGQRYRFMAIYPKHTEHLFNNNPPAGFANCQ